MESIERWDSTVLELLINDCFGISDFSLAKALKMIQESPMLEPDRKNFLENEILTYSIRKTDQKSLIEISRDPKVLIFFIRPYQFQQLQGTLIIVLKRKMRILYPLFLRRKIIEITLAETGFSFKLGPTTGSSAGLLPPGELSLDHKVNSQNTMLTETESTEYSKTSSDCDMKNLREQVKSLQLALASSAQSFVLAERIQRFNLIKVFQGRIRALKRENHHLKGQILLLEQQLCSQNSTKL